MPTPDRRATSGHINSGDVENSFGGRACWPRERTSCDGFLRVERVGRARYMSSCSEDMSTVGLKPRSTAVYHRRFVLTTDGVQKERETDRFVVRTSFHGLVRPSFQALVRGWGPRLRAGHVNSKGFPHDLLLWTTTCWRTTPGD
jgi:hypothetical protein